MGIEVFLRSVFVYIVLFIFVLFASPTALIASFFKHHEKILRLIYVWFGKIPLFIAGITVTVHGNDKLDKGKTYIFASNHQSQIDIFAIMAYIPFDLKWMVKKELFKIPIFGFTMKKLGHLRVDRSNPKLALKSLDKAAQRVKGGTSVLFFPEGTRSLDSTLLPFKKGTFFLATRANVPVVPVTIIGSCNLQPKGEWKFKKGSVTIIIDDPIDTSAFTTKEQEKLSQMVQDIMIKNLGRRPEIFIPQKTLSPLFEDTQESPQ